MQDFYAPTGPAPLDQADGLRRLFGGRRRRVIALASNPFVAFGGVVLERLTSACAEQGCRTLVVDAAESSPVPRDMARLDLAACIEPLSPQVSYLAARGLPLAHVDTRGSAERFLDALAEAAPETEVLLLHATGGDLARMFQRRAVRPLLLAADHPDSIKHAYASCKLLAQRCRAMTFDLLLAAPPGSPRLEAIAQSMAGCADSFLGVLMRAWACVDPASEVHDPIPAPLQRLVAAQLALDDEGHADWSAEAGAGSADHRHGDTRAAARPL